MAYELISRIARACGVLFESSVAGLMLSGIVAADCCVSALPYLELDDDNKYNYQ